MWKVIAGGVANGLVSGISNEITIEIEDSHSKPKSSEAPKASNEPKNEGSKPTSHTVHLGEADCNGTWIRLNNTNQCPSLQLGNEPKAQGSKPTSHTLRLGQGPWLNETSVQISNTTSLAPNKIANNDTVYNVNVANISNITVFTPQINTTTSHTLRLGQGPWLNETSVRISNITNPAPNLIMINDAGYNVSVANSSNITVLPTEINKTTSRNLRPRSLGSLVRFSEKFGKEINEMAIGGEQRTDDMTTGSPCVFGVVTLLLVAILALAALKFGKRRRSYTRVQPHVESCISEEDGDEKGDC